VAALRWPLLLVLLEVALKAALNALLHVQCAWERRTNSAWHSQALIGSVKARRPDRLWL
jgi:hypothetical protein